MNAQESAAATEAFRPNLCGTITACSACHHPMPEEYAWRVRARGPRGEAHEAWFCTRCYQDSGVGAAKS